MRTRRYVCYDPHQPGTPRDVRKAGCGRAYMKVTSTTVVDDVTCPDCRGEIDRPLAEARVERAASAFERAFGVARRRGEGDATRALKHLTKLYLRVRKHACFTPGRTSTEALRRLRRKIDATERLAARMVTEFQVRAATEASVAREKRKARER